MPMTNAFGNKVDSGDFPGDLRAGAGGAPMSRALPDRRRQSEARGMLRGLGFAYHIKATGGSPHENVDIRFEADGTVSLITGTQTIGQGHETTFPQILADRLGVAERAHPAACRATPTGSRSAAGTAARARPTWAAPRSGAPRTRSSPRGSAVAAEALEAAEADILLCRRARSSSRAPTGAVALVEVAAIARDKGTPLDTYHAWTREWMTFPNGTHVVEVEIDRETGRVSLAALHRGRRLRRAGQPDDRGGPGAWRDGAGRSARRLLERAVYDAQTGQLVAGSFMDYALPRADDLVVFGLGFNGTRCTTNPLGVKGCGEAGAVAAFPAVMNAIADALGEAALPGPATPEKIWRLLRG